MTVTLGTGALNGADRVLHITAQLREVEYWRRLVTARLDLAVATLTSASEPDPLNATRLGLPQLPCGLRHLIGVDGNALPEAAALERLRDVLDELDRCALHLRSDLHALSGLDPTVHRTARHTNADDCRTPASGHCR